MKKCFAAAFAAIILGSCASMGDPFLVAFSIPPKERSAALAQAGIDLYETGVVVDADFDALARARKYFEAALRYDPSNAEASRYLSLAEDYRASRFEASLSAAQELARKDAKTDEESYALHSSLRRAVDLDPKNEDARKLMKETEKDRLRLIAAYLDKSAKTKIAAESASDTPAKERAYIEAFTVVSRAAEIEPSNFDAAQAYRELRENIEEIMHRRIDGIAALFKDGTFNDARAQLAVLEDLDAKLGKTFRSDLRDAEYSLYYAWAQANEQKKDWDSAEARIVQAQSYKRSAEAAELAKRVAEARTAEDRGANFAAGLKRLDSLIAKGDLNGAQRSIAALSKSAADSEQRKELDKRRKAMRGTLGALYEKGVKAYREERFKDAVSALRTVVNIDPSYLDAGDYLDKAQSKQRLIDQY